MLLCNKEQQSQSLFIQYISRNFRDMLLYILLLLCKGSCYWQYVLNKKILHQSLNVLSQQELSAHFLHFSVPFVVVQSLSHVPLFTTPQTTAPQDSLSFTISWNLLKHMYIASVMPSNHLILCRPLLLLPSIFPSIRVFSRVSSLHLVAQGLELQLQHSSSNDYSGLISFRIDCFDHLAVQRTLKEFSLAP